MIRRYTTLAQSCAPSPQQHVVRPVAQCQSRSRYLVPALSGSYGTLTSARVAKLPTWVAAGCCRPVECDPDEQPSFSLHQLLSKAMAGI